MALLLRWRRYPITMAKRLGESEQRLKLSSLKFTAAQMVNMITSVTL
jgi:hypothetical protein